MGDVDEESSQEDVGYIVISKDEGASSSGKLRLDRTSLGST